ncbi:MAG: PQQ-dependent sugar dehydrogenase [Terricaulis sp.]
MRLFLLAAACLFAACAEAQPERGQANADFSPVFSQQTRAPLHVSGAAIAIEQIARGLHHPWAIAFLPDGRALVSERSGRLRVVSRDGEISGPVAGLPRVDARGQGGLLDVALSPDFSRDRLIYWSYSEPREDGGNGTSVARGRLSEDAARVSNVDVIFRQTPSWRSQGHFGSRLDFDRDGHLFITLGERQSMESRVFAQDLSTHFGKIVRINADGSVPADNPFAGRQGVRPEIWSYGHRNPQGADIDPATGVLWTIEHGPRGGDELNPVQAGRNYGWPIISYGEEYDGSPVGAGIAVQEGMEQPAYYWDPVIAPGDMDFYEGDLFPWRGDILIAGLRSEALVRLELEGGRVVGEERFELGIGRIRDLAEAGDGAVWIVTDEGNGRVLRLTPTR